jgi:hypothetical protein
MSLRLLLIDDAEDVRLIATLSPERVGDWTVVPVGCGKAANESARARGLHSMLSCWT